MRFLLDQNIDRRFVSVLRARGDDVTVVAVHYRAGIPDSDVLAIAEQEGRTLMTNDPDFGELAIRHGLPHAGVVLFRLKATDYSTKLARLQFVLDHYSDQLDQFLVVTN